MSTSLTLSAFLMGVLGGPHCAAMCGPACAGVVRVIRPARPHSGQLQLQTGRVLGYALGGAIAAWAVESFAWLTSQTAALRPVWTFFHLAVLAWGMVLLVYARQPQWAGDLGRGLWTRVRPVAQARGGLLVTGMAWMLMPCGLLYSALLLASLSGGPLDGALTMAAFALGGTLSLGLMPWLLLRLEAWGQGSRQGWGARLAGLLLIGVAAWALWADTMHRIAQWCGLVA